MSVSLLVAPLRLRLSLRQSSIIVLIGISMVRLFCLIVILFTSSCVYTLDIQQGNILDQKEVDRLRAGLSKNQVIFVLGSPVADDSFSDNHWVYLYTFTNDNRGVNRSKKLELFFQDDKLVSAKGDYTIPDELKTEPSE